MDLPDLPPWTTPPLPPPPPNGPPSPGRVWSPVALEHEHHSGVNCKLSSVDQWPVHHNLQSTTSQIHVLHSHIQRYSHVAALSTPELPLRKLHGVCQRSHWQLRAEQGKGARDDARGERETAARQNETAVGEFVHGNPAMGPP